MIVGVGVDSVDIDRIQGLWQRCGDRFLRRVFTSDEVTYCLSRPKPAESLAARFAAKEATLKCLGTGWAEGLGLRHVEVRRDERGAVQIELSAAARVRAGQRGIRQFHLSLTHSQGLASAFVVAEA